jgi:hypothetical protein
LKKRILLLALSVLIISALTFIGCTSPPEEGTPASPFAQLEATVNSLSDKVSGIEETVNNFSVPADLESRIATVEGRLTSLQTSLGELETQVGNLEPNGTNTDDIASINTLLEEIDTTLEGLHRQLSLTNDELAVITPEVETLGSGYDLITTDLATLQTDLVALQAEVDALPENPGGQDYSTEIASINQAISNLQSTLSPLTNQVSTLQSTVDSLVSRVNTIESGMDDIMNMLYQIDVMSMKWDDMYDEWVAKARVELTRFVSGSNYLEITTRTSGDYIINLTLYGTNLNALTLSIPPSQGVTIISSDSYGVGNTMRVVLLEPTTGNWSKNKVIEVDYTGAGSVLYATVMTGVR